eukprot:m.137318 g.137318  ORF g.137318 m.137318 type:complete len:499 (-) comp52495_c0_seq1:101-1597(-)
MSSTPTQSERDAMRAYWEVHAADPTIQKMMLDSNAAKLHAAELPEVLELLPSYANKRILELGAGIGRFTGELAKSAAHVTAVDFMQSYVDVNKSVNGALYANTSYLCADVTTLEFPANSFDFVFSNWLFMYLTDQEVEALGQRILQWLTPNGQVFFRESCRHQSGDSKRGENPSKYRQPEHYHDIFASLYEFPSEATVYRFDLVQTRSIQAYITIKNNPNQISWQWVKVEVGKDDERFQNFLDKSHYTPQAIKLYEAIFGQGFGSTGGLAAAQELASLLKLQKDQYVLDVGTGIGGCAIYMAKEYGVHVRALDLSANMIDIAKQRLESASMTVTEVAFVTADVTQQEFVPDTFDVIHCRDAMAWIVDKEALLQKFFRWLKPGGKILVTDYCVGDSEPSDGFKTYLAKRQYSLIPIAAYTALFTKAGFDAVAAEDRHEQFQLFLKDELSRLHDKKHELTTEHDHASYDHMVQNWLGKLRRSEAGEQKWAVFLAQKPASA